MKIRISAKIDIGIERENNEDAITWCTDLANPEWDSDKTVGYAPIGKLGALAVVADGMGGANAGEVASAIAIQTVKESFTPDQITPIIEDENRIKQHLSDIVTEADKRIYDRVLTDAETSGMGTTIVICWVLNNKAYIAWCGDSRCYVSNPSTALQSLTKDHSLVQEMVDNGQITQEEAFDHPDSNIITRGLGDFGDVSVPDIVIHDIKPNDTLLLCSDGLCGYCEDSEIQAVIEKHYNDTDTCCNKLMQLAIDAGGYDNISIVAISVISDQQDAPSKPSICQRIKRFFGL